MKLPVFPNWYPYNNMFFDGHLRVGGCSVKTRNYLWDYRGPVLFYNSGRTEQRMIEIYGYERGRDNHKVIIGVADLIDVRGLTTEEAKKMVCNFNCISRQTLNRILRPNRATDDPEAPFHIYEYGYYVAPLRVGYFFKNLRRLSTPVPFNWPAGPVKPIFTEITRNPKLYEQLLSVRPSIFVKN